MKRLVLVTGAAGVMGSRLVWGLLAQGYRVRCLTLPGDPGAAALAEACEVRSGDLREPSSLAGLCEGVDSVLHLAGLILSRDAESLYQVNRDGTMHLLQEAVRRGVKHFVYVSSASVVYPTRTPYGQSKFEAEALVRNQPGIQHTIVRPTLIYDRAGGQEFVLFLRALLRFPVVPFVGPGRALKRPLWAGDVTAGLIRVLDNPISHGKIYNFSGPDRVSLAELADKMLAQLGETRMRVHLPLWLCRFVASVLTWLTASPVLTHSSIAGMRYDADLDPSLAMRELGFAPLGLSEGFARHFPTAFTERVNPTTGPSSFERPKGLQP